MSTIQLEISNPMAIAPSPEDALWETYGNRIFYYLLRMTGQRELAEDLTQETFVRAIRDRRRLPTLPTHEKAWLFRVATNVAQDHFRRRRLVSMIPFLPDKHDSVAADAADAFAEQQLVAQAIRRLPPEMATVLLLKDAEGFTAVEIATMLGQNHAAVRKRLSRAREAFRKEYLALGGDLT